MVDSRSENRPFLPPNFETISFSLPTVQAWEEYIAGKRQGWCYLTDGNPSLRELEELLATMQQQESCWLTSTGKSAMASVLMALLGQGEHLLLLRECYKSTRHFVEQVLTRFGVEHTLVGVDELDRLEDLIRPNTRLLIAESPSNPMTRVPDFERILDFAATNGLYTVLDNSLSGFHQHGQYKFDIFVHSLSKFASGTGDLMGGAVIGAKEMVSKIRAANCWNSDTLSTAAALGIWKGMQTYALRIARQSATALSLAEFLSDHPAVQRVLYPGLPQHPDYQVAKRQMTDFGSVIAFDVNGSEAQASRVLDSLRHFRIAFGTGFTQSIANPAWLFYARSFSEPLSGESAIRKNTIRLSVGIEPADTLRSDLDQALRAAHSK